MNGTDFKKSINVQKGQIWWVNLGQQEGSIQSGERPVLVMQNNMGNKHSPTVTVCPISSQIQKMRLPTHVRLNDDCGLIFPSFVMLEQPRTINKSQLKNYVGKVNENVMKQINIACKIQFGVNEQFDINEFISLCNLRSQRDANILAKKVMQYCVLRNIAYKINSSDNTVTV